MMLHRYGPWAVVTGASSGIGHAFARHLARAGINVVLAARSTERLLRIGEQLQREHGTEHRVVGVDLATAEGAAELIGETADLDVGLLVSNAGDGRPADFLDHDVDELRRELQLNAFSHLELVHHFGGRLVQRGRGGILLTSASVGFHGLPHMANVAAAKGYLHHLGEALHHEFAPAGVDVTVLMPGNVDTPIVGRIGFERSDFPLPLMDADTAVAQAMRALGSGAVRLVPGVAMRVGLALLPRRASVRLNGQLVARALARRSADEARETAA